MVADWVINTPLDITVKPTTINQSGDTNVNKTPNMDIITATRTMRAEPNLLIKLLAIGVITIPTKYTEKIFAKSALDNW